MEFITEEQFKDQPIEVQEYFVNWWQPSIGDLVSLNQGEVFAICDQTTTHRVGRCKSYMLPLLTEGQLRKFIEDKTSGIVKVIQWHLEDNDLSKRGYSIDILKKNRYGVHYSYNNLGENLIQAYWKVACCVAKQRRDS